MKHIHSEHKGKRLLRRLKRRLVHDITTYFKEIGFCEVAENVVQRSRHLLKLCPVFRSLYAYRVDHVLVGGNYDIRRIPHRGDAAADVGVDNYGHQHRYRVEFHHLTQPIPRTRTQMNIFFWDSSHI